MRKALALLLCLLTNVALADGFDALGQRISFTNPNGYCAFGSSEQERTLWRNTERAIAPGARLVFAAAPCSELKALREGRSDGLDHWLQIQILGPKGNYRRLDMGREEFLVGLSKTSPKLKTEDVAKRYKEVSTQYSVSDVEMVPLGRDGNAVYFTSALSLRMGASARRITLFSAITLVNSVPLTVHVYEATGHPNSRQSLQPLLGAALATLLSEN